MVPRKRSNSTGTIFVDNTICTQDVSVTIKVVCSVIQHHIYDSFMNRSVSRVGSYDETTELDQFASAQGPYFKSKGNQYLNIVKAFKNNFYF